MKCSKKIIPLLTASALLSGCSLQDYWQDIENYLYVTYPNVNPEKICVDHHFHKAKAVGENLSKELSGDITYFYWFGSDESKKTDRSLAQVSKYIFDSESEISRIPAINNNDWIDAAKWSLSLNEINVELNQDVINASYDVFLNNKKSEFDHVLLRSGKSPQLFYEVFSSSDFKDEIFLLGDATYQTGVEKIPAIMVDKSYIVYPSDYKDPRDAWIVAGFLLNSPLSISQKCL